MTFIKATREKINLRAALLGPAGSGKTIDALLIAKGLGGKTAVLDTEHGSARRYANLFDFDTQELDNFAPENYERVIHEAENAGYANLVIDSLSHAWAGKGGILEFVDNAKRRGENAFTSGWRDATPKHNSLVETMLATRLNLIVTLRVKMDYVVERDERGKNTVRKVGLQPIQRDGLSYEFDLVCDVDIDHNLMISKSRFFELADQVYNRPTEELGRIIKAAITSGESPTPTPAPEPPTPEEPPFDFNDLMSLYTPDRIMAVSQEVCNKAMPASDEEWRAVAGVLEEIAPTLPIAEKGSTQEDDGTRKAKSGIAAKVRTI